MLQDTDDLVDVYIAGNVVDAYLVKELLNSEGIDAVTVSENSAVPGLSNMEHGRVSVRSSDAQQARMLLEEWENARPDYSEIHANDEAADELL